MENFESKRKNETSESRWNKVELGLIQIFITKCLKNISNKVSVILTSILNIILSLSDTVSDIVIVYSLYVTEDYMYALVAFLLDYLPGWQIVIHNVFSKKWSKELVHNPKVTVILISFLVVSPFSLPLLVIHWLLTLQSSTDDSFNLNTHNSKLSQLLNGAIESPAQVILLLVLWGEKKLPAPWSAPNNFVDAYGNQINLGMLPSLVSLLISCSVVLKGTLDLAGKLGLKDGIYLVVFAVTNSFFRITSFALAILHFKHLSIALFLLLFLINCLTIVRHDEEEVKSFSLLTSSVTSIFCPFLADEETQWLNLPNEDDKKKNCEEITRNRNRNELSAKIGLMTVPLILVSNLLLLLLLVYGGDFRYSLDIIVCRPTAIKILVLVELPAGVAAIIACIFFLKANKPLRLVNPRSANISSKPTPSTNIESSKPCSYSKSQNVDKIEKLKRLNVGGGVILVLLVMVVMLGVGITEISSGSNPLKSHNASGNY